MTPLVIPEDTAALQIFQNMFFLIFSQFGMN